MKRKIILIVLAFGFNILWVNAISGTNSLASNLDIVIKTSAQEKLNNSSIMKEIDVMLRTDLEFEGEDSVIIGKKIDNYLKNELSGKGEVIAKYSIVNEVNPYLVASMIIKETGCNNECSFLVKKCNNVGKLYYNRDNASEMACYGGFYQKFDTINDSVKSYTKYIRDNYYEKDLTTPSAIASANKKKYDVGWVYWINNYMTKIKKSVPLEK